MSKSRICICVKWLHDLPSEPVLLYSELDSDSWEIRKIEIFRDGTVGYADQSRECSGTKLSKEPLPSIEEIASDKQFVPKVITSEEFEAIWQRYAN